MNHADTTVSETKEECAGDEEEQLMQTSAEALFMSVENRVSDQNSEIDLIRDDEKEVSF